MTRKDYIAIARAFARTQPADAEAYATWCELRDEIMAELQADNPRFDRERFIEATE